MERILDATTWSVTHDIERGLAAKGWTADYVSGPTWDADVFRTLRPYRGEDDPDTVIIRATVDGRTQVVADGIVDENRFEQDGDGIRGALIGRDRIATLLDRTPAMEITIKGAEYRDGVLRYRASFKSAIQRLCRAAGVTPLFVGPIVNYRLGTNVVVTPQRTYGEAIDELVTPLRWSERHAVDTWMEGTILYVVSRDAVVGDPVVVPAEKIRHVVVERTRRRLVSDVRVEGFSYQIQIDDTPSARWPTLPPGHEYVDKPAHQDEEAGGVKEPTDPIPGRPWPAGYFWPEERSSSETVMGRTESYVVKEIEWYNARGQLTRVYRRKTFTSKERVETTRVTYEYDEDTANRSFGNKIREVEVHHVKYYASVLRGDPPAPQVVADYDEVVRERKTNWTYWADNGDTRSMNAVEVEKDESAGIGPLPLKLHRVTTQTYRRSGPQVWRETEIVETDKDGVVKRSFEIKEVGPFRMDVGGDWIGAGRAGADAPNRPGKRSANVIIASGPKSAPLVLQSGLLGDAVSVAALRAQVLSDHGTLAAPVDRYQLTLSGLPDLAIRPGVRVVIQHAGAHWPVSEFLCTAVAMRASDGEITSDIRGVAWQDS